MLPNPDYILCPPLQDYFVDKVTGQALSGGIVTFYSDINRSDLKPIYTITGSPPNYEFIQINSIQVLGAQGTFVDNNNNDIPLYLFPLDENGDIELYYITVTNSIGVPQFTRQAWPPGISQDGPGQDDEDFNFIPNGQFLVNYITPYNAVNPVNKIGELNKGVNVIASGGWTFEKSLTSNSIDSYTFPSFGTFVPTPTGSPRYVFSLTCSTADSADFKILGVKFFDVNKFSSSGQEYTFFFSAQTASSSYTIQVYQINNFGTGGSATIQIPLGTFEINQNWQNFSLTNVFTQNTESTIGPNGDDYVQLAIVFPNIPLNYITSDYALVAGNVTIESFPVQTNGDMIARGVAGFLNKPNQDGSDLYLPIVLTQQGQKADDSCVGRIEAHSASQDLSLTTNLLGAGGGIYKVDTYSNLGIPYSRLFKKIIYTSSTFYGPAFGTGQAFVTAYLLDSDRATIKIVNNQQSPQSPPTQPGSVFNIFNVHSFDNNSFVNTFLEISPSVQVLGNYIGMVTPPSAGTSGFSIGLSNNAPLVKLYFFIIAINAPSLAGRYFSFNAANNVGANVPFYMWFTVDGSGSDPSPGGFAYKVNLLSSYSNIDLNYIIKDALNGYPINTIGCPAASAITSGDYWQFTANSTTYTVYYDKDNAGNPPVQPNLIKVPISGTFNASQVANITMQTINSQYYAVPNLNGMFLRFVDNIGLTDTLSRGNLNVTDLALSRAVGSFENYSVQQHAHNGHVDIIGRATGSGVGFSNTVVIDSIRNPPTNLTQTFPLAIDNYGFSETTAVNTAFQAYIRY